MNGKQTFIVTPQDRMNYLLGLYSADQQITAVLYFPAGLSNHLLEQSVRVAMKLQPILNCRFVEAETPYWEEQPSDVHLPVFLFEDGNDHEMEAMVLDFIKEPGDRVKGPMVQTKLFRTPTKHILVVKLSHLCSDGAGVKEYIQLLASVYTRLSSGEPVDQILEEYSGNSGSSFRDQFAVFQHAGVKDVKEAYRPDQGGQGSLWSFPSQPGADRDSQVSLCRLSREGTKRLIQWAKARQVTVNDIIMTAYFRSLACFAVCAEPRTPEKMIGMTVDLRRYLPDHTSGAICNLSGMEIPVIKMNEDEPFAETLQRVKQAMDKIKSQSPGISSAAGMQLMSGMNLSALRDMVKRQHEQAMQMEMALPLITNFGVIADKPVMFGHLQAEDGYMVSPIMYAPFFAMGVSTYLNRLTFSIGYHTPGTSREKVEQFLCRISEELSVCQEE